MVNPVVLIATHQRWDITCASIDSLLAQSIAPRIILVVSEAVELRAYEHKYPLVEVVAAKNEPIGEKWQTGVVDCYGANPLIILGSDDILGNGFIENACRKIEEGYDFVGLYRWWVHDKEKAYLLDYKPDQPLGGGRIYSRQMLEFLGYKLFDISKNRHLDDYAWAKVCASGLKIQRVHEVEDEDLILHAIKGKWPVMNRLDLRHPNIKLLRRWHSKSVLGPLVEVLEKNNVKM